MCIVAGHVHTLACDVATRVIAGVLRAVVGRYSVGCNTVAAWAGGCCMTVGYVAGAVGCMVVSDWGVV